MADIIYAIVATDGRIVNRVVGTPADTTLTAIQEPSGALYAIGGAISAGVYTPPFQAVLPTPDPMDSWDKVMLLIAFNQENRIRVLESRPAITLTQFKTSVAALLAS